jgi:CDP-diacylglycerol--glycerol-3-phosphate 3-phosphatidyltransferase
MKIANKITVSRMLLSLLMTVALTFDISYGKTIGLVLFLIASITDYIDGKIARMRNEVSTFGKLMDPLADKMLICSAFICFVAMNQIVPAWVVIIIIMRELLVTGLRLLAAGQGIIMEAGKWGKHKTAWQIIAIILILATISFRCELMPLAEKHLLISNKIASLLHQFYGFYFVWLIYILVTIVLLLTVTSGTIYFWQCRKLVLKNV